MPDAMEDRLRSLEEEVGKLRERGAAPKGKDVWDKLSALSALISGVILASIGIWVNQSLTTGQQRAQDAQANATREMERAHNEASDRQADQALKLQALQAANALDFQKQQAANEQAIEKLKMVQQQRQAMATQTQQRQHDAAELQLQQTQLARDFLPQLEANPRSRAAALQLMTQVNPQEALILSQTYLETSADTTLQKTSTTVITSLEKSPDPALSRAAYDTRIKVASSKRIQAITNLFETGRPTRDYGEVATEGGKLSYGGFLQNGEALYEVVNRYCAAPDAEKASALKPYLDRIKEASASLQEDEEFKTLLKDAGRDPVMQRLQDDAFAQEFWLPAQNQAAAFGLKLPLSLAALYDTEFMVGRGKMVAFGQTATAKMGGEPAGGVDEKAWAAAYVAARRGYFETLGARYPLFVRVWLKRTDFFAQTMARGDWNLDPPLAVNGIAVTD